VVAGTHLEGTHAHTQLARGVWVAAQQRQKGAVLVLVAVNVLWPARQQSLRCGAQRRGRGGGAQEGRRTLAPVVEALDRHGSAAPPPLYIQAAQSVWPISVR
jgi:hypothetical protein